MPASREERLKVLKMLAEGRITPEDAARLLTALETAAQKPATPPNAQRMRIRVTDMTTRQVRVNVTLPITAVQSGLRSGARFSAGIPGLDAETLQGVLNGGKTGKILDVIDKDDNERVEIILE
ncbi:MAG: hypothetical protein JXB35_06950 [Anaerolineae bacterium]|nr:hypothetical protein [Anaerolineae bacterium]